MRESNSQPQDFESYASTIVLIDLTYVVTLNRFTGTQFNNPIAHS